MSEHNTQPSPRILRMEKKIAEIQSECNEIREYTKSEAWNKVDQLQRELIGIQYSAMQVTARVLNVRLKIAYGQDAKARRPVGASSDARGGTPHPATIAKTTQTPKRGNWKRK